MRVQAESGGAGGRWGPWQGRPHFGLPARPPQPLTRPLLPSRCYILENDTVQCDLGLYRSLQAWKDHKLHIDHEVREVWAGTPRTATSPQGHRPHREAGGRAPGGASAEPRACDRPRGTQVTALCFKDAHTTFGPFDSLGETGPQWAQLGLLGARSLPQMGGGTKDPSAAPNPGPQSFMAPSPALCPRSKPCRTKLRT